jgi:hypothetical protein
METIIQQINARAAANLQKMWGGRTPTWEEFKEASRGGRVRVNKSVANIAIHWHGMPKSHMILFGIITLWATFLAVPIAIALHFITGISAWWIAGSAALAWYLYKVSIDGQCEGIRYGAEANEELYKALIQNGAFLFGPKV